MLKSRMETKIAAQGEREELYMPGVIRKKKRGSPTTKTVSDLKSVDDGDGVAVSIPDHLDGRNSSTYDVNDGTASRISAAPPVSVDLLYRNLYLFVWLKTIGSYDSGAFSAASGIKNGIRDDMGLSDYQIGKLASSVFLGNVLGCPLAGHLFRQYDERRVLNLSLIFHGIFTFLYAVCPGYYLAMVNRFFIGLTLAFIVVYTPVWVDEFAPKERQSVWMASHNAGVPLGIMMGYLFAAYFASYTSIGWEWSFYIKVVLMVPTVAYVTWVDPRSMNVPAERKSGGGGSAAVGGDEGDGRATELGSDTTSVSGGTTVFATTGRWEQLRSAAAVRARLAWASMKPLALNPVYMCCVFAMCAMYLVATGLQTYVTPYLQSEPFNASTETIMLGFGAAVVTAPVLGVITGGILLDRCGGYQHNLLKASLIASIWAALASTFSVVCIFVNTTSSFLFIMSVVLFCGGAIIPSGAGLTMASLPPRLRSFGAAFSQTMYNMLGNFSGPLLCGYITDRTQNRRYGIATLLLCSVLGVIPMFVVFLIALRERRAGGRVPSDELAFEMQKQGSTEVFVEHEEGEDGRGEGSEGAEEVAGRCGQGEAKFSHARTPPDVELEDDNTKAWRRRLHQTPTSNNVNNNSTNFTTSVNPNQNSTVNSAEKLGSEVGRRGDGATDGREELTPTALHEGTRSSNNLNKHQKNNVHRSGSNLIELVAGSGSDEDHHGAVGPGATAAADAAAVVLSGSITPTTSLGDNKVRKARSRVDQWKQKQQPHLHHSHGATGNSDDTLEDLNVSSGNTNNTAGGRASSLQLWQQQQRSLRTAAAASASSPPLRPSSPQPGRSSSSLRHHPHGSSGTGTANDPAFLHELEKDMQFERSIPSQHAFGMDIVLSWLHNSATTSPPSTSLAHHPQQQQTPPSLSLNPQHGAVERNRALHAGHMGGLSADDVNEGSNHTHQQNTTMDHSFRSASTAPSRAPNNNNNNNNNSNNNISAGQRTPPKSSLPAQGSDRSL